jgi:hypothetical protein
MRKDIKHSGCPHSIGFVDSITAPLALFGCSSTGGVWFNAKKSLRIPYGCHDNDEYEWGTFVDTERSLGVVRMSWSHWRERTEWSRGFSEL